MSTSRGRSRFNVGDRVRIDFGRRKMTGVIVEDHGALGVKGQHLFQVDIPMDPFDHMSVALAEDEIEAIPPEMDVTPMLDKPRVTEYLVHGGLIAILRSNLVGGKLQPRAWLYSDQLGNVTHTFIAERGLIGGQVVPVGAIRDGKISTAKRDAVVSFLESFALNHQEAEQVVAAVGTAP